MIKHSFKNSKNIFLAQVLNQGTETNKDSSIIINGGVLNTYKTWKGSFENGTRIGRFPNEEGGILKSSCDKQLISNKTYIFLQNGNAISICQISHLVKQDEVELISNFTIKQLKSYLIKSMKKQWKSIKKKYRVMI